MTPGLKRFFWVFLLLYPMVGWSAEGADLANVGQQLAKVIPDFKMGYRVERTRSKAFVTAESSGPVLTIDPEFLQFISPEALLFVAAHEYAHVYFHHQKKLELEAMRLAALPTPEMAFDALATQPAQQEKLDAMNRQFELDADEQAVKWLAALHIVACSSDILASIDDGGVSMVMDRSHPGFYARKQLICRNR